MSKVLFLFSGQLRGFPYSYPTIQQYFENIFSNCNINYVFNILQENYSIETIVDKNKIVASKVWEKDPVEDLHSFCIPNGIGGFSQHHSLINKNVAHENKFKHFMLQWYFVKGCYNLVSENYDTFDYVVRIRPDLFFYKPLPNIDLQSLNNHTIIIPKKFDFGGICDRLAIGRPSAMKTYLHFYDQCNKLIGNSESRLATFLQQNNIDVLSYDIEFCHINNNKQFTYCVPDNY